MKGDTVEVLLDDPQVTDKKIVGVVEQVFDALTPNGEPDINLEIDIRYGRHKTKWFRYKPAIDGGTIRIIETKA